MTYRVLLPIYEKTGEVTERPGGKPVHWERIERFVVLGGASDMEQAKEKFGGAPILEWVNPKTPIRIS
jgi:hypothetical protein